MEYLQYLAKVQIVKAALEVLNLVISGIPSIPEVPMNRINASFEF